MKRSDEELVARTLEGDTGAFAELVERYRDAAYGVGLHMLGDPHEAAELAQDAFIRAWRALHQLREPAKFPAWLCRIAGNLARRRLSARAAAADPISLEKVEEIAAQRKSPPDNAQESEMISIVRQLVETLPDDQRLAFTLFYVNGYSYADLSKMLDLPEGTVKTQLSRARARLKRGFVEMAKDAMQQGKPDAEFWRSATGTVCGRVTSAATGDPIEGAMIQLHEFQTAVFAHAKSGHDGVWEAKDLLPGAYCVRAYHPDFALETFRGDLWGEVRTSAIVRPGQTVREIDFRLQRGARIRGGVVDQDGCAVVGARVFALRRMSPVVEVCFEEKGRTQTDDDGNFELISLPPDDYVIGVDAGEKDDRVYLRPATYYPGTFSLHDAEWVSMSAGEASPELTVRLVDTGTTSLNVRVIDEEHGSPISGARVLVGRREAPLDEFIGHTDAAGYFRSAFLTRGPFRLTVGAQDQGYARWAKWLDIEGGQTEANMEFQLPKGVVFEGQVVTEDGSAAPPLEMFNCSVIPAAPEEIDGRPRRSPDVCDSSESWEYLLWAEGPRPEDMRLGDHGHIWSPPVSPGSIRIFEHVMDKEWKVTGFSVAGKRLHRGEEVECGPGERIEDLKIIVGTNLGIVAGRVVSAASKEPVESAGVHLSRRDEEQFWTLPVETDRSGSFFFHSVPAGPYEIGVARSLWGPTVEESKREITVEPGKVVHLDLVLPEQ